jgi:hypothetical protein
MKLDMRLGGSANYGPQPRYGTTAAPATATAAAYGPSVSPGLGIAALAPTSAVGIATLLGALGFAWLIVLYCSLPE